MKLSPRPVARLSVLLVTLAICAPASAATINVTTNADGFANDSFCSLREAISVANGTAQGGCDPGDAGADVIALPADTYMLTTNTSDDTNAAGDLDITSDITLQGAGSVGTTINAQQNDRVIDVISANVTISGVTITGGKAKDGSSPFGANFGGGIRHYGGTLTLSGVTVTGNVAGNGTAGTFSLHGIATNGGVGGFGGGVYSSGLGLTITGSTISNNVAGNGGDGGNTSDGTGGFAGSAGRGGGIGSDAGDVASTFTITDTTITGNAAGNGGKGGTASSNGGTSQVGADGGVGGGFYVFLSSNGNTSQLSGLTVTGNHAGAGGASSVLGGTGGTGGGILTSGKALLTDSTISGNFAGAGGPGNPLSSGRGGPGGSGGGLSSGDTITIERITASGNKSGDGGAPRGAGGNGGGLNLGGAAATLTRSTISGNTAGDGAASNINSANFSDAPGVGGHGGGMYVAAAFTLTNTTIANNTTGAGGDYTGTGCPNWAFGQVSGAAGGLFMNQYNATVTHVTVAGNSTGAGGHGSCNGTAGQIAPSPRGGIVMGGAGTLTLSNSLVASNNANDTANCYTDFGGTIADGGGNLEYPHDYNHACHGVEVDPKLGPLASNGGPTQTMALLDGSGAIDIGAAGPCLSIDQRGTTRPQGSACDAGAFEKEQAPVTPTNTTPTPTDTTPTPTDTTPTPTGSTADKTKPVVKLLLTKQRLLKALKKGYVVVFTSNEAGNATATLSLKKTKVASGKRAVTAGGKLRLVAKFTKKAKKALAKKRSVKLRLVLVTTDNAGNATTKTVTVKLKR